MRIKPLCCIALCAAATGAMCFSQTAASFSPKTSPSGIAPYNVYTGDFNNDGITDVVQDTGESAAGFTVSLGNGDGTFKAPNFYPAPISSSVRDPLVVGDFNNDGKMDVALLCAPNPNVAVFLGNGNGTFQAAIVSTISLPANWGFSLSGAQGADFNADGKLDLAAWAWDNSTQQSSAVYVVEGDGTGRFTSPHQVLAGPANTPSTDFQISVGDYDADGKTDISATSLVYSGGSIDPPTTTVHVLYGNNDFTFEDTTPLTQKAYIDIGSGDLNGDGFSDLYALTEAYGTNQLAALYGNGSRTFSSYFTTLSTSYPLGAGGTMSQFALADFNGDGRMDLAAIAKTPDSSSPYSYSFYLEVFLATGHPGQFTIQRVALPSTYPPGTAPVAGLFGGHLKPDVAINESNAQNTSYLLAEINQAGVGKFGPCNYPRSGEGFNVCSAGSSSESTSAVHAAVNSFGELRKIELWVDGKKVTEQHHAWDHHAWFNYSGTFAAGTHQASLIAADVDNRLQKHAFSFTSGGSSSCSAPSSNGVHVCSPVNGSSVASPVKATATAKISGTLSRMEIWVDGVKKYSENSGLTESTSIALAKGKHTFKFNAINTAGTKWVTTVYSTVQ
jgi:hypothetical protein